MRPSLPIATATIVAATALSASALTATSVLAQSGEDRPAPSPRPSTYTMPGDAVYPEGIARDPRGRAFYVTSTTDGTVFRGDVRRSAMTPLAAPGADGRTTAVGIKADRHRRLVVAGGATGKVFVLDARTGRTISALDTRPGDTPAFLNDVALTSRGVGYVTDSRRPTLYRVTLPRPVKAGKGPRGRARTAGTPRIEPFLSFAGTAFDYEEGFNANGIVAARGGRILLVVQSNTGELFRVDTRTKDVSQVDLGGRTLTNGDGLLLRGRTLYVVRNQQELVVPVRMSGDLRSGRVGTGATSDALRYPTTIASDGRRLLAVNAQFDRRSSGAAPDLPFTVVAVDRPRTPSGD